MPHVDYDILPTRTLRVHKFRLAVVAVAAGLMAIPAVATLAEPANAAVKAGVPAGTHLTKTGTLTVTRPGTVIDAKYVRGAINVKADNVTIKRTKVSYSGYHSIRIFPGADGTVIQDSTIICGNKRTNGVVFGNYTAIRVKTSGCRNDFASSASSPAKVYSSLVDGQFFTLNTKVKPTSKNTPPAHGKTSQPTTSTTTTAAPTTSTTTTAAPTTSTTTTAAPTTSTTTTAAPTTSTTTTAAPTTSTTTSTPTTSGSFPTSSTTGVPAGTTLTTTGGMTITTDGAVIDAKLITGSVVVKANNVRIKRSLVRTSSHYAIQLASGYSGLVVEDSEIDGLGASGPAVVGSGYTLRRMDIYNITEGPRLGSNTVVEYSYIHDLKRCSGCHIDVLQSTGGSNIVIRGNNLQAYNPATDDPMNAVYQFGEEFSPLRNVLVVGNLVNGGNYTMNGGGGGTTGAQVTFRDNRFQRDFRYGPIGNFGSNVSFDSSNVWNDTGKPVS